MELTNRSIVDHLIAKSVPITAPKPAIQCLMEWLKTQDTNVDEDALLKKITNFVGHLSEKWKKCSRCYEQLCNRHASWIDDKFLLPTNKDVIAGSSSASVSKGGRPSKSIEESSVRSKRRKLKSKYGETSSTELLLAVQSSLFAEGKRNQSNVIATASTEEGAQTILDSMKKAEKFDAIRPFTPEEALILMLDCGMSKATYRAQRKALNDRLGMDFLPSYDKVIVEKRKCYPADIQVKPEG